MKLLQNQQLKCRCEQENCIAQVVGDVVGLGIMFVCPTEADNELAGGYVIPYHEVIEEVTGVSA